MNSTATPQQAAPAEAAAAPCVRCGYDLHGHSAEGVCPECGLAVARSLALGKQLRDSRPAWIASLAWAARLLLAMQLALMLAFLVVTCFENSFRWAHRLCAALLLTAAVLHAAAAWLMTRRENPFARRTASDVLGTLLRCCAIAPVAPVGLLLLLELYGIFAIPRWAQIELVMPLAGLLAVLYLLCPMLEFVLLRRLARRVLDESLAEHAGIVANGQSASICLLVGMALRSMDLSTTAGFLLVLGGMTALLLFWIWSVVLLLIFATHFARGAREARRAWQRADAARGSATDAEPPPAVPATAEPAPPPGAAAPLIAPVPRLPSPRPRWFAGLAWGSLLLLLAQLLLIALAYMAQLAPLGWQTADALLGAVLLLCAAGIWLLTRPQSPNAEIDAIQGLGAILRALSVPPVSTGVLMLFGPLAARAPADHYASFLLSPTFAWPLLIVALLLRLTRDLPLPKPPAWTCALVGLSHTAWLLAVACITVMWRFMPRLASATALSALDGYVMIAMVLIGSLTAIMLVWFTVIFHRAAEQARRTSLAAPH
jgi:hypothetical protein